LDKDEARGKSQPEPWDEEGLQRCSEAKGKVPNMEPERKVGSGEIKCTV
jgi:hypothetical protein